MQPEGKHFLVHYPLEDGEDKQHPVWSYRKRSRIELIWSGSVEYSCFFLILCFMLELVRGTLNSNKTKLKFAFSCTVL